MTRDRQEPGRSTNLAGSSVMLNVVTDRDAPQVGALVASRRGELGMTQQDLAKAAEVDIGTIGSLEAGRRWPQAKKRAAIEKALRWAPGDLARLRHGGEATSLPTQVAIGHGITVDADEETDPEALRQALAKALLVKALAEDLTWTDVDDKLDAIADLHGELRAILRKLRPSNGG